MIVQLPPLNVEAVVSVVGGVVVGGVVDSVGFSVVGGTVVSDCVGSVCSVPGLAVPVVGSVDSVVLPGTVVPVVGSAASVPGLDGFV